MSSFIALHRAKDGQKVYVRWEFVASLCWDEKKQVTGICFVTPHGCEQSEVKETPEELFAIMGYRKKEREDDDVPKEAA